MIAQLGAKEAREVLSRQRLGRLGCCLDNEPYVVPVNYLFEDDCIYIHALPAHCAKVKINDTWFYHCGGTYYQPNGGRYVVVYIH